LYQQIKYKMVTQKQLDKMPEVSTRELVETSNHLRNYYVHIGEKYVRSIELVHVGFGSKNHLETIKELINNQPIIKVLLDNRKFGKKI